jgi:uncharacterized protein GlcG (DUF336 family)
MREATRISRSRLARMACAVVVGAMLASCSGDNGLTDPNGPLAAKKGAGLPSFNDLRSALTAAVAECRAFQISGNPKCGLGFDMWATIVDRQGIVRTVVFSGDSPVSEWPGSRVISAQKANTGNAFSLKDFALSSANLYSAVQPGGSLFGLQESNPVDATIAYEGKTEDYGTPKDGLIGKKIGGINVFGGGLALYAADGTLLGGLGLSGDTSCADHFMAWLVRHTLGLDHVPAGVADNGTSDQVIFDITNGMSPSGFGHPHCIDATAESNILAALPPVPAHTAD